MSDRMRLKIEEAAQALVRRSPLLDIAERGELSRRGLATYLEGLRLLFQGSQESLRIAGAIDGPLQSYFQLKCQEEAGHDAWAIRDAKRLTPSELPGDVSAISRLISCQRQLIDRNPALFVAYAQWAEYFTTFLGGRWLAALRKSGFASVTAIANHVEADQEHAREGFEMLDQIVHQGLASESELLEVVDVANELFIQFADQVVAAN